MNSWNDWNKCLDQAFCRLGGWSE